MRPTTKEEENTQLYYIKYDVYTRDCTCLTHSLPIYPFSLPPEDIRNPNGFLMFSWVRERVHWERMG